MYFPQVMLARVYFREGFRLLRETTVLRINLK